MTTFHIERLESHPASHLADSVHCVRLPEGNGYQRMLISFRADRGFPFLPPLKFRNCVFVHEVIERGEDVGQSWRHVAIPAGLGWIDLGTGFEMNFSAIDDERAVVEVRAL